jgi:hypothetical protein
VIKKHTVSKGVAPQSLYFCFCFQQPEITIPIPALLFFGSKSNKSIRPTTGKSSSWQIANRSCLASYISCCAFSRYCLTKTDCKGMYYWQAKYFDRFQLNRQTQDRWVLMLANKWSPFKVIMTEYTKLDNHCSLKTKVAGPVKKTLVNWFSSL